jgi:hypothetical protein
MDILSGSVCHQDWRTLAEPSVTEPLDRQQRALMSYVIHSLNLRKHSDKVGMCPFDPAEGTQ